MLWRCATSRCRHCEQKGDPPWGVTFFQPENQPRMQFRAVSVFPEMNHRSVTVTLWGCQTMKRDGTPWHILVNHSLQFFSLSASTFWSAGRWRCKKNSAAWPQPKERYPPPDENSTQTVCFAQLRFTTVTEGPEPAAHCYLRPIKSHYTMISAPKEANSQHFSQGTRQLRPTNFESILRTTSETFWQN